jgi:hypothetical protein
LFIPSPKESKEKAKKKKKKKREKNGLNPRSIYRFLCRVICISFFFILSPSFSHGKDPWWLELLFVCRLVANRQPVLTGLAPLHLFFQRHHLLSEFTSSVVDSHCKVEVSRFSFITIILSNIKIHSE